MVLLCHYVVLNLLGAGLAVAAPEFDPEAELRKSDCDNGCFDDSFPGGSCTNDAACMCTQQKYREVYFCCLAEKCDSDVMPESIERQHTECSARNLDFSFDADKVCDIKLTITTSSSSMTTGGTTPASTTHGSPTETSPITTISTGEITSVSDSTKSTESAKSDGNSSTTSSAVPVADSASQKRVAWGNTAGLIVVSGLLLL